jgi:hypothetical protein
MDVTATFPTTGIVVSASLQPTLDPTPFLDAVVVAFGDTTSIQVQPDGAALPSFDETFRFDHVEQGAEVWFSINESVPQTLLRWSGSGWNEWTQLDSIDGAVVSGTLSGIKVSQGGAPTLQLTPPVFAGDIREPIERDYVRYLATDTGTVPWSVSLVYAGSFGRDSTQSDGVAAIVTVATSLGVEVVCDGPATSIDAVAQAAQSVAASLRVSSP